MIGAPYKRVGTQPLVRFIRDQTIIILATRTTLRCKLNGKTEHLI